MIGMTLVPKRGALLAELQKSDGDGLVRNVCSCWSVCICSTCHWTWNWSCECSQLWWWSATISTCKMDVSYYGSFGQLMDVQKWSQKLFCQNHKVQTTVRLWQGNHCLSGISLQSIMAWIQLLRFIRTCLEMVYKTLKLLIFIQTYSKK